MIPNGTPKVASPRYESNKRVDSHEPLMPQMLQFLTQEEINALAVKQLERQGRQAMRSIRRSDNAVKDCERLAATVFHSVKKLMPAERALQFANQIWEDLQVDTRETRYTQASEPLSMTYFMQYIDQGRMK